MNGTQVKSMFGKNPNLVSSGFFRWETESYFPFLIAPFKLELQTVVSYST